MQTNTGMTLFEQTMKSHHMRISNGRRDIFQVLSDASQPLSIQEIVARIDSAHFVSVYRSIDALRKVRIIKQVPQGFKNRYELSDSFKPHHHHISCERCDYSAEINDKRIESLMKELAAKSGLTPTTHHFEMYGICEKCRLAAS